MEYIEITIGIIIAYLFGSISTAILVCKLMNYPDPRTEGSKNPGATNILRIAGKKAAAITLLGDALKGIIPVLLAKWYGFNATSLALITLAAFLGHLFPIFFGFKGGKGVATAFGCLIALNIPLGLALIGTWLTILFIFRYSSLSAIVCAIFAPLYTWYFTNITFSTVSLVISILLIYRHKNNIKNLFAGKEKKIGKKTI